jgi:hypothetical protein
LISLLAAELALSAWGPLARTEVTDAPAHGATKMLLIRHAPACGVSSAESSRSIYPGPTTKATSRSLRLFTKDFSKMVLAAQMLFQSNENQELVSKQYVWVLPWRTEGWKFLVGVGVLAFVIWKRRNFGRAWYAVRTGKPPPEDY